MLFLRKQEKLQLLTEKLWVPKTVSVSRKLSVITEKCVGYSRNTLVLAEKSFVLTEKLLVLTEKLGC